MAAWAADPFLGQWKLNPKESVMPPGQELKDVILTFAQEGDGIRATTTGMHADGTRFKETYVAIYDGQERPSKGPWNFDAVINRSVSDHEREAIFKRDGKKVGTLTMRLSADEKRLSQRVAFGDETSTRVYDRQ